ncbi:MAG: hypothetical protein IJ672_06035, partial [Methanobrevibacter sp.]|nr:hypothetical protein [Methanobrevibacter sp.]
QEVQEVMDVAKKLSLVNNGLKTIADENVTMKIAGDNTVVEELGLNPDGKALATSKTLMVADTYRVDKLDNQWNAAGLVHIINKEDIDNDTYKQQIILTTLEHYEDLSEELTAYNAELFLRGKTTETNYAEIYNPYLVQTSASGSSGSIPTTLSAQGQDAPIFKMDAVPENDRYAVEIFGYENNYFGYNNIDKTIFSNNNITFNPGSITDETLDDTDGNILFNSNYNYINGANLDNMLINADYNYMNNVLSNMLIGADANIIKDNAAGNILFGTNFCTIDGSNTISNIIIGGTEHRIKNSKNIFMLGKEGLLSQNRDSSVLFGEWNKDTNAGLIYGIGTSEDNRQNAMEFFPGNGKLILYKNNGADVAVVLGGKNAIEIPDDVEVSFKKLHVERVDVDSYFIVGEAQGFGYSDYGAYIKYNSASKNTDFTITVPGIAGASLNYSTDTQTFSISDNHPYSRNADFVSFNNEYASFTKAVDYTSDHGPYIEHSILIHQDKTDDLQKTKTPGVLTVYEENAGGLHGDSYYNKVNIYGDKIVFSEYNTETLQWEETKTIDKGETYNKIAADVHVWGPGISDWSMDMRNYRGSKHYKKWLNNIWNLAPPIMYSDGNDRPTTNGAYVSIYDTARGEFRNIYFDENGDSGDENAFTEFAAAIANAGPSKLVRDADEDKYLKYYTEVPDGLDEIEINLYMHSYSDRDIGLIWLPLVDSSSEKVPQIIINLFMDNMDSGGEDIFAWNAKNYGEEQKPEFDNIRDVDKCKFIQLRCTPAKGSIYTGPTRDGHSNSCGWWPCD